MSYGAQPSNLTMIAASTDLPQYHIAQTSGANTVGLATTNAGSQSLLGVVQNIPAVAGDRVNVCPIGDTHVFAGAAITAGANLTVNGSGRAIVAAPTSGSAVTVIGKALEAATADGDVIRAFVHPAYRYTNVGY